MRGVVFVWLVAAVVACGGETSGESAGGSQDGGAIDIAGGSLDVNSGGDTADDAKTSDIASGDGIGGEDGGTCVAGAPCDDGNPCTIDDFCQSDGSCTGGPAGTTDDPCMVCTCTPESGVVCEPASENAPCDDGDCCTGVGRCESCDAGEPGCGASGLTCVAPPACDDGKPCTLDACDCSDGTPACSVSDAATGTPCVADANLCTVGDYCDGGACVSGPPASLDDGNPCTQDVCVKGAVQHTPLTEGQCDDGNECTKDDHCFLGNCVGGGAVTCEVPACAGSASCQPGEGCVVSWLPTGASCVGDDLCAAGFACSSEHQCLPTTSTDCDDDNACTSDSCSPSTGECVNTALDVDCQGAAECIEPACNPATGGCDLPVADGTPCSVGTCEAGECVCTPMCDGVECGDDSCGGSCGDCAEGQACTDGMCGGCEACPNGCLPDGGCCPDDGFCPGADTTLSGTQVFSVVHIPAGVTVTCAGPEKLVLEATETMVIAGTLRADGPDGSSSSGLDGEVYCGGSPGGDGFRSCTSGGTTFCETSTESEALCSDWISPKEGFKADPCVYLATAPGQPGDGFGGGFGGGMAHPITNAKPGSAGGGGGGSYGAFGLPGEPGTTECAGTPVGGARGAVGSPTSNFLGGSGGGAGGFTRNGQCGAQCPGGCTGWGGDGGNGGGAVILKTPELVLDGLVSARGGAGAKGSSCGGSGGGGSGGYVRIESVSVSGPANVDVSGGAGGPPGCGGAGAGGAGGIGHAVTIP